MCHRKYINSKDICTHKNFFVSIYMHSYINALLHTYLPIHEHTQFHSCLLTHIYLLKILWQQDEYLNTFLLYFVITQDECNPFKPFVDILMHILTKLHEPFTNKVTFNLFKMFVSHLLAAIGFSRIHKCLVQCHIYEPTCDH